MKTLSKRIAYPLCLLGLSLVAVLPAANEKPTIAEMINRLKPDSLRLEKGKWLQTWVHDPGFDEQGPAVVDIQNGYASFIDSGTGAGTVEHEFAVYYPEAGGAILVHNYANDTDTYKSELKFYQLRDGKLEPITMKLPKLSCRDLASEATRKNFYQNTSGSQSQDDPVLPTYSLPRKGTTISASCDSTKNRFGIEAALADSKGLSEERKLEIIAAVDFPVWIEYKWNKKQGVFVVGKRHTRI